NHPSAIKVSDGVSYPELVEKVNPDRNHPDFAKIRSGIYIFDMVVNEKGEVVDPFFLRGPEGGGEAYLKAVLARWRYKPALRGGKPVSVFITVTFSFSP
ncbi:MAG TPA: hypothetical protein VMT45_13325, partial [Thermoanaerobaculaceae bacterium]|nr:hypothetical protein [Thermoanaerobaculaceae bacterium]